MTEQGTGTPHELRSSDAVLVLDGERIDGPVEHDLADATVADVVAESVVVGQTLGLDAQKHADFLWCRDAIDEIVERALSLRLGDGRLVATLMSDAAAAIETWPDTRRVLRKRGVNV